jgi:hypothetical protein
MLSLRPGNVHAALGGDDDLAYLVTRLRQAWPNVVLNFRGGPSVLARKSSAGKGRGR